MQIGRIKKKSLGGVKQIVPKHLKKEGVSTNKAKGAKNM